MSDAIPVLIVEGHPIVRQGLRQLLEVRADMEVVGEAETGEKAVEMGAELLPDVVLMDLVMRGIGGVEAIRQLRQISDHSQVVVLTSHYEDALVFLAIKAGALSYLLKSALPEEVVDAVQPAARREARLHPRVAGRLMKELSGGRSGPMSDVLTARELEVLMLIAQGLSNQTIADRLTLSEKTVKTHVSNLLGKLQLDDRTQAAIYALRQHIVPLDE